jgi:glycosyltransferase involved in cell wall biosynthesis
MDPLRRRWYRRCAVGADAVITISEFSKREIVRAYRIPEQRVRVIYSGVDPRRFRPVPEQDAIERLRERYSLGMEFLLFVGDVHPRRNVGRIIDALPSIRERTGIDVGLILAGRIHESSGGPVKTDAPGVRHLGYVPEEDLALLYNAARALVYPSFYEGFGLPIVEAMASGCPVIVSRGTACDEIAGAAGLRADPADTRSVAEAAIALLADRDLAHRQVELGKRRAQDFNWRKCAEATWAVYGRLIEQGRSGWRSSSR